MIAGALGVLAGCQGPCESLQDKICSCEPNSIEQAACLDQVQTAPTRTLTEAETQRCSDLLDTCTCDALQREELQACGLAK